MPIENLMNNSIDLRTFIVKLPNSEGGNRKDNIAEVLNIIDNSEGEKYILKLKNLIRDFYISLSSKGSIKLNELFNSKVETKEEIIKIFGNSEPGLILTSIPDKDLDITEINRVPGLSYIIGGSIKYLPDNKEKYFMLIINVKNNKSYFFEVNFRKMLFFPTLLTSASQT